MCFLFFYNEDNILNNCINVLAASTLPEFITDVMLTLSYYHKLLEKKISKRDGDC